MLGVIQVLCAIVRTTMLGIDSLIIYGEMSESTTFLCCVLVVTASDDELKKKREKYEKLFECFQHCFFGWK